MSDKAPLFISSVELLSHSIELYREGNERKFKFIILHLANAVELILKDRLLDKGVSIYKNNSSMTIGIWDSFEELEGRDCQIPERPIIELLVDDRNTIQHRFGFPDSESVYYYLEHIVNFFSRFLDEEYDVELAEVLELYLEQDDLQLFGLGTSDNPDYEALDELLELSPEAAVVQAYSLLEGRLIQLLPAEDELDPYVRRRLVRTNTFHRLISELVEKGLLNEDAQEKFHFLRELRNRAAHAAHFQHDDESPEWSDAIEAAKELVQRFDELKEAGDLESTKIEFVNKVVEMEKQRHDRLVRHRKRRQEEESASGDDIAA